ncbi:MAG: threonine/serine exporter family protein [Lachnospiraceae bacterium]|nr:threonine/serine exporter family protein [Lachnospiraceae bacterium]
MSELDWSTKMDYEALLDLATELGYQLARNGAETFRIEESIVLILASYGIAAEAFAIPNCLIVSMRTPEGKSLTRMRRIGYHGNDLDSVEHYSNLSRRICQEKPDTATLQTWLTKTGESRLSFSFPFMLLGSFLGAGGFSILFGGTGVDALCAGICGLIVGLVNHILDRFQTNSFFRTILAAFFMAVPAYAMGELGIADNADAVVIGALMLLVPGLLFTNAMRDIIFGDTNSGVNRIVQVFLIAAAIALGTGAAWNLSAALWGASIAGSDPGYPYLLKAMACFIACTGFSILFNIHGMGTILCCLGGVLTWTVYLFACHLGMKELTAYFFATLIAAIYAETMARIRKFPAISYLVVSVFPLIPGAGVYYTMNYIVRGEMDQVVGQGLNTVAIAGYMAVAILLVSTLFRLWSVARKHRA